LALKFLLIENQNDFSEGLEKIFRRREAGKVELFRHIELLHNPMI
jgi:hypothetical protein